MRPITQDTPASSRETQISIQGASRGFSDENHIKKPADAEFVEAAQVSDSEATLTALPSGPSVTIRVLSANEAGYALPSEQLVVTVP